MNESRVELPLERFERLLVALEDLVQSQRRERTRRADGARRAAQKAGPTTERAMRDVQAKLRKKGML